MDCAHLNSDTFPRIHSASLLHCAQKTWVDLLSIDVSDPSLCLFSWNFSVESSFLFSVVYLVAIRQTFSPCQNSFIAQQSGSWKSTEVFAIGHTGLTTGRSLPDRLGSTRLSSGLTSLLFLTRLGASAAACPALIAASSSDFASRMPKAFISQRKHGE